MLNTNSPDTSNESRSSSRSYASFGGTCGCCRRQASAVANAKRGEWRTHSLSAIGSMHKRLCKHVNTLFDLVRSGELLGFGKRLEIPLENNANGLTGRSTFRPGLFAFSIIIFHSRKTRSHHSSLMRVGAGAPQRRCLHKTPRSNEANALCRCSENVQLNRFIKITKVLKLICSTDFAVYV